ncbi:MAG: hypothetical protein U1D55_11105 [Phycisphaerae bacterium]
MSTLTVIGAAIVGCAPQTTDVTDAERVVAGETVIAGQSASALRVGSAQQFEINVPAGQALEFIVRTRGAALALADVTAPDGAQFSAGVDQSATGSDGRFRIESLGARRGFRFVGTSPVGGVWRLTVDGAPLDVLDGISRRGRTRSAIENLALLFYLLNGQPQGGPLESFVLFGFPQAGDLRSIPLSLEVNIVAPAEVRPSVPVDAPGTSNNDGNNSTGNNNSNSNSNSNDNTNDNGNGNDNSNTNDNGNSNSNDNTNDNGSNNTPPPAAVTMKSIVRTGDAVPDMNGATFAAFGNPIIDSEGRVAFWARYTGGAGDGALFVWENNNLRRVVDDNPANVGNVPGRGATERFGDFNIRNDQGSLPMVWGSNGRLVFVARTSSGNSLPNGMYRWRASDGEIIRVADDQMMQAAFPNFGRSMLAEMFQPALTDAGTVVFGARYTYFTQSSDLVFRQTGVFSSNATTISPIAASNASPAGSVPDNLSTATFNGASLTPMVSAAGDILLQAQYTAGFGQNGVFLRRAGGSLLRAIDNRPNASFPGLPAGAQLGQAGTPFDAIALGANSRIAVDTQITDGASTREALLYWNGQQWMDLRPAGVTAVKSLLSGINDRGQVLVLADGRPLLTNGTQFTDLSATLPTELAGASVTWEAFGDSINNSGRALLRYNRGGASATPGLALWTGEKLIVVADAALGQPAAEFNQIFAVARPSILAPDRPGTLKDLPETDRPGRSGALNDLDQLVIRVGTLGADGRADTSDDVQAIYVGTAQ